MFQMQNKEEWEKLLTEVKTNAPGPNTPEIPDPSTAVSGEILYFMYVTLGVVK